MSRISLAQAVAGAATLLAAPTLAQSQTASDSARADSASRQLQAVNVSASRAAGLVGGASAVIIKPQELRSSPAPLLHQALRESPFVLVRQNSRGEMEISVRGSDSRQAAVLLDGVPITLGWDHRTDPSLIPVTGTEQMVIVRGLGSVLNGPNTLGGTIDISHDPFGQPRQGRLWAGAGVDQTGATVGTLGFGKRVAEFGNGGLSLSTGVAHRDRRGFVLPKDAIDPTERDGLRTGTDQKQTDGFASLRWNNLRGSSVGFTVSGYNAERGVPPEEHLQTGARFWRYPYARRVIGMFSANSGVFNTPLGHGSVEAGVGVNNGNFKVSTFADRTYATTNGEELGDERTTTGRVAAMHSVGPATLRASFTHADIKYTETLSPTPAVDYQQKLMSTGVELEVPIMNRTRVSGGYVFDDAKTPVTGGRTPEQEPFSNAGWRVGVSHDLTSMLRLHGSASERSRFPALRELYSGALNRFRPNPDLKPETLLGFEAGITASSFIPSIAQSTVQVIGFRHKLDDAVIRI
ncbi:MAG: TonB-dependent receptor plug domain-containing protein, partial [Gemmatimonas sp.]